jgi:hypothetical protein
VAFFAGLAKRPYFEFHRTGTSLRAHRVYLRDFAGDWYQNGLPGAGTSADELAAHLRAHCDRLGAARLVTAGNSAGGFAAILFGMLAGADEVHSFSPKIRAVHPHDFRDQARRAHLHRARDAERSYRDLTALLAAGRGGKTAIHVHYPDGDPMDATQAELLAGVPNVSLWKYRWPRHGVVRALGKCGTVAELLENAVTGEPRRVAAIVRRGRWRLRVARLREVLLGAREEAPATD